MRHLLVSIVLLVGLTTLGERLLDRKTGELDPKNDPKTAEGRLRSPSGVGASALSSSK